MFILIYKILFLIIFNLKTNNLNINLIKPIILYRTNFNINSDKSLIEKKLIWSLTIPKINLENIEIYNATSEEVLNNYIAHFEHSAFLNGNVCLAAHSNGYKNNYFSSLELLSIGDNIIYTFNGKTKEYKVSSIYKIKENEMSCLDPSTDDIITLITCVKDSPHERLCVKGICIKEEI